MISTVSKYKSNRLIIRGSAIPPKIDLSHVPFSIDILENANIFSFTFYTVTRPRHIIS